MQSIKEQFGAPTIDYPELPEGWDSAGGEGSGGIVTENNGYTRHWYAREKYELTLDTCEGFPRKHYVVHATERPDEMKPEEHQGVDERLPGYQQTFVPEKNTIQAYLTAKQKAWNHAVEIMKRINKYGQPYEPDEETATV